MANGRLLHCHAQQAVKVGERSLSRQLAAIAVAVGSVNAFVVVHLNDAQASQAQRLGHKLVETCR